MMSIKDFFKRYSYDSVRMALNQVATSMFGFALAMTAVQANSQALLLGTSIGSIAFYLFLAYGTAWRMGSNDRMSIEYGKFPFSPWRGILVSLLANSLNFLLAILIMIGALAGVGGLETIPRTITLLIQAMYQGTLAFFKIGGEALNERWWVYFLLPLPAMITSLLGYVAGAKDFHITKMGIPELPESDRPSRQEMKAKRAAEKQAKRAAKEQSKSSRE